MKKIRERIDRHLLNYMKYLSVMNYSGHTINQYYKELKRFIRIEEIKDLDDMTRERVTDYLMYCYNQLKLSNNTISRIITIIRSFNAFLHERDLIEINFLKYMDTPKKNKPLPKIVEESDVQKIFTSLFTIKKRFLYRDHFILALLYGSGLRVSELVNLKEDDIDIKKRRIKITHGKGQVERYAPISDLALESYVKYKFTDYRKLNKFKNDNAEYLILNKQGQKITVRGVQYILSNIAKKLEITNLSPHMFRHSFATTLMNYGLQVHEIQVLLGHKSIAATQVYLQVNPLELYKVIKLYHPLNKL